MSKKSRKPGYFPSAAAPTFELPDWAKPNAQPPQGVRWLTLFGFDLGDDVVIFPIGMVNQSLQGELVDISMTPDGGTPVMITIRNAADRPNVSVPWSSIMMITKAEGPRVEVPQPADITLADLAEFAEAQGVDIPDEVRAEIDASVVAEFAKEIYDEDAEDEYGDMVVTNTEIGGTDFDVLSQF